MDQIPLGVCDNARTESRLLVSGFQRADKQITGRSLSDTCLRSLVSCADSRAMPSGSGLTIYGVSEGEAQDSFSCPAFFSSSIPVSLVDSPHECQRSHHFGHAGYQKRIAKIMQRVQREITGYYCGYTLKGRRWEKNICRRRRRLSITWLRLWPRRRQRNECIR